MFSIPPAITTSLSPKAIDWAACIILFIPDEQTLFTVVHGTSSGIPAFNAACLAGAWPTPAWTTWPINTSLTSFGCKLILSRAPLIAMAPKSGADTFDKAPKKLPIGVLTADTITTSFIYNLVISRK